MEACEGESASALAESELTVHAWNQLDTILETLKVNVRERQLMQGLVRFLSPLQADMARVTMQAEEISRLQTWKKSGRAMDGFCGEALLRDAKQVEQECLAHRLQEEEDRVNGGGTVHGRVNACRLVARYPEELHSGQLSMTRIKGFLHAAPGIHPNAP